jgi:lipoprotein-releasing system ATP-binding protein
MSDDLDRILHESTTTPRRPTPLNPHVHAMPRVHGGQPLHGGPKLELPRPRDASQDEQDEAGTLQTPQRITPEASLKKDHPKLFNGPHFPIPPAEKPEPVATPTSVAIIPSTQSVAEEAEREAEKYVPAVVVEKEPATQPSAKETSPKDSTAHLLSKNLHKSYRKGQVEVPVLRGVDIEIRRGEFLAIEGQSGSGKSTLLHLLGTLDQPDKGEVRFCGKRIDNLPFRERDEIRNKRIGMIFQFYHLLPELSTLENVLSPIMISEGAWSYWKNRRKHSDLAKAYLNIVGLSHRLKHKPRELSGGEMQRAAIARALIAKPEILLADEPTGNLDQSTGREILKILRTLNKEQNLTIVMVTHDQTLARQADRIVRLSGGVMVG